MRLFQDAFAPDLSAKIIADRISRIPEQPQVDPICSIDRNYLTAHN